MLCLPNLTSLDLTAIPALTGSFIAPLADTAGTCLTSLHVGFWYDQNSPPRFDNLEYFRNFVVRHVNVTS